MNQVAGRGGGELAPHVPHIHVRHVREGIVVATPDILGELIARDNRFGAADEVLEQSILGVGQGQGLRLERDPVIDRIDGERSVAERARGLAVAAAAIEGSQPGEQLLEGEWLGEVVVRAAIQHADAIADRMTGADDQDRRVDALIPHVPADLEAVQARQHQVEDDGVVLDGDGLIDSRGTVLGEIDDVVILAESLQQEPADRRVVLNE